MDNVDKDRPNDASGQPPSAESSADDPRTRTDQEADAHAQARSEQQSVSADQEASTGGSPQPSAGSGPEGESTQSAEAAQPGAEWPPEEIRQTEESGEGDIAIGRDDEQVPHSGAQAEPGAEGEGQAEDTSSPGTEAGESKGGADEPPSQAGGEAVVAQLEQQRNCVVKELFAEERPRQAKAEEVMQAYAAAVSKAAEAEALESSEAAKLAACVSDVHDSAVNSEQADLDAAVAEGERHIETYDTLFRELKVLVGETAEELARLDQEHEDFQSAPEDLQSTLLNFKKGIEIIHRMFDRTQWRKKDLSGELSRALPGQWQPDVPSVEPEDMGEFVMQLSQAFHQARDANYHASQNAKKSAEKCRKTAANTVSGLLSAIDGIDAGLQNEPELRAGLSRFEEGEQNYSALIESWLQAYHRLAACVDRFFRNTGIEAHTVEPGTPFDPETMEPQGTVANPEMNDEDVAAVMRRGFSLKGETIRPILVDVVKNT
ncbi:MAG: nucleotide exchange factor GrpE [Planctomycetota bacterium]